MTQSPARKTKGRANHFDVHIGQRVRARRVLLGISQEKLANAIGLTFQQIQKYERGVNRISAGRLFELSQALDIDIRYFYDHIEDNGDNTANGNTDGEYGRMSSQDRLQDPETIKLVQTYYSIRNENARKDIFKFIKSMVKNLEAEQ